jgi:hypothetical protein
MEHSYHTDGQQLIINDGNESEEDASLSGSLKEHCLLAHDIDAQPMREFKPQRSLFAWMLHLMHCDNFCSTRFGKASPFTSTDKIPVLKKRMEQQQTPARRRSIAIIGVFVVSLFSILLTYKNIDRLLYLWGNSNSRSSGQECSLSLEKVKYVVVPDPQSGATKIIVVGEIVNNQDSSLRAMPLEIKVSSRGGQIGGWYYFPGESSVLPNEHILFKTEGQFSLRHTDYLVVEVLFKFPKFHTARNEIHRG